MEDTYLLKNEDLVNLCILIKQRIKSKNFAVGEMEVKNAMSKYPHSAIPHNLLGILLEKQNNHVLAMKHFRAAYSLDPTYWPVRHNLDLYASFYPIGHVAYDESDCTPKDEEKIKIKIVEDEFGIGHVMQEIE
ncbi:MAG: hypothetical protein ACERKN_20235 [Velocimicrobium sp.]